jgi:hypothetical protein
LPLTQWEEHRFRVIENRVMRKITELKRDEVIEEWRRLHNDELHDQFGIQDDNIQDFVGMLKKFDHFEDPVLGGRKIFMDFKKVERGRRGLD